MKSIQEKSKDITLLQFHKMQAFDYNNLYQKSKLYVHRALEADRESDLFPFWLSLSLELLSRSTLAKISPSLLAEISQNDNSHLLYALGFETTTKPKSIPVREVFNRLSKIGIEFTDIESKTCISIIEQRNAELHSGIKGFDDYPVSLWLSDFYRVCKILLTHQGLNLIDFLGTAEAKAAEFMITEEAANLKNKVLDKIQNYKKVFFELNEETQEERRNLAKLEIRHQFNKAKIISCPVCDSNALLSGELINFSEAKLVGSDIKQERRFIPTQLGCLCCGIRINGYPELKSIDLGGQFILEEYLDPIDYHGIDPEEYVDVDELVNKRLEEQSYYEEYGDE